LQNSNLVFSSENAELDRKSPQSVRGGRRRKVDDFYAKTCTATQLHPDRGESETRIIEETLSKLKKTFASITRIFFLVIE
jgi:hypothetical protein